MKKIIYTLFALVTAGFSTSCLDEALEVESKSSFEESAVFSNYTLASYNIIGISEVFGHTNSYRGRVHLWYGFNNDVEWYNSSSHNSTTVGNNSLAEYSQDISNSNMNTADNAYNELFVGIERANLAIRGLRTYGNVGGDRDMAHLLGEALTMRAFLYYELIKMWGDVPARFSPIDNATIYVPKANRDEIYKQILSDLDEAIGYVYWPGEETVTARVDRVNKAFAKGLFARVAMAASGYAWRPEDGKQGTGDAGSMRLSTDPELSKSVLYPRALAHLKDVIESGHASLDPSYENFWRRFNNNDHLAAGAEVLYVIPFSDTRGRWNYTHAIRHTGLSPYTGGAAKTSNSGGQTGPVPTLWWKYAKEDVRRDLTCANWTYEVDTAAGTEGNVLVGGVNTWYWSKFRFDWQIKAPYKGGNDCGTKPIVMRYPDVLLMAAELAAYTGDLPSAKNYLLQVRQRAYAGNESVAAAYVNALSAGNAASEDYATGDHNSEGTITKAIIDERALEFAGEMLRKADLIRWGLLKTKIDQTAAEVKSLAEMTGAWAAYNVAAKDSEKTGTNQSGNTVREYSVYWRPASMSSVNAIEVFGLEADQIGKTPEGYSEANPGSWIKKGYISTEAFYSKSGAAKGAYKYDYFYNNSFNDPWPRSTWPIFGQILASSQGALVNDFGY
jgi:hypothetical protein